MSADKSDKNATADVAPLAGAQPPPLLAANPNMGVANPSGYNGWPVAGGPAYSRPGFYGAPYGGGYGGYGGPYNYYGGAPGPAPPLYMMSNLPPLNAMDFNTLSKLYAEATMEEGRLNEMSRAARYTTLLQLGIGAGSLAMWLTAKRRIGVGTATTLAGRRNLYARPFTTPMGFVGAAGLFMTAWFLPWELMSLYALRKGRERLGMFKAAITQHVEAQNLMNKAALQKQQQQSEEAHP
jgi:hypothetical protein